MEGSALLPLPEMIHGLVGPAVGGILVVSLCLHRNNEDAHCPHQCAGGTRPRFEKNDYGNRKLPHRMRDVKHARNSSTIRSATKPRSYFALFATLLVRFRPAGPDEDVFALVLDVLATDTRLRLFTTIG